MRHLSWTSTLHRQKRTARGCKLSPNESVSRKDERGRSSHKTNVYYSASAKNIIISSPGLSSACALTMPSTTRTKSSTAHRRLISVAISLVCGIFIAGRLHLKQWAHEFVHYRDGKENDALVSIVFETVYPLLRIFVGGYGGYAVFRDLIGPIFQQHTTKQKSV